MESGPFSNAQVKTASKKLVMLKVVADSDSGRLTQNNVSALPTFQVLDPEGKEVWRQEGYMEADALLRAFADAVARVPPPAK